MIYGPLTFRDFCSMFWFMLTSPAESKKVFPDLTVKRDPPPPLRMLPSPLPPFPPRSREVRDADLAELIASTSQETDPWRAIETSFTEWEAQELSCGRGEHPPLSRDYYVAKLRGLRVQRFNDPTNPDLEMKNCPCGSTIAVTL